MPLRLLLRPRPRKRRREQPLPALESHLLRRQLLATVLRLEALESHLLRNPPPRPSPLQRLAPGQVLKQLPPQRALNRPVALESHLLRHAALLRAKLRCRLSSRVPCAISPLVAP